ncbi:MAG: alpha/beta fold hydrolase [Ilumatobacteraceae bacterium]
MGAVAAARYQRRVLSALLAAADADEDVDLRFPGTTTHRVPTPDGGHLHVQECGAGPTVLLLHGHGSNLGIFGLLAGYLQSAGHHVVAMDQRGFGRSSTVPQAFAFDGSVDDVAMVLGWLDLHQVIVVGHSMGGAVALGLAIGKPQVVPRAGPRRRPGQQHRARSGRRPRHASAGPGARLTTRRARRPSPPPGCRTGPGQLRRRREVEPRRRRPCRWARQSRGAASRVLPAPARRRLVRRARGHRRAGAGARR